MNIAEEMTLLYSKRLELKRKRKAHRADEKPLKDEISMLEASIEKQVLESGKTIQYGGIKAEYKPTVVFKMKKEKQDERNE